MNLPTASFKSLNRRTVDLTQFDNRYRDYGSDAFGRADWSIRCHAWTSQRHPHIPPDIMDM